MDDTKELISRMRDVLPKHDTMRYDTAAKHLDWETVKFGSFSAAECKNKWVKVSANVSRYQLLFFLEAKRKRFIYCNYIRSPYILQCVI